MARLPFANLGTATACAVVVLLAAFPAFAQDQGQRLSLAQRVTRLEQQVQQSHQQGGVALVNQIQSLQAQNRQLQGQVEELQHEIKQLQEAGKDQYVDLDSRLKRLEGGAPAAASSAAPASATSSTPPAASTSPAPAAPADASTTPAPAPATAASTSSSDAGAQAAYDAAFKALRDGDFVQSSRGFRDFIQQYPDDKLAPNAYYWLGESYYITQNYTVALQTFQKLIQLYPQSSKTSGALLKAGYCQYAMKQTDAATATLKSVIARYPGSSEASLAKQRLQDIQLQRAH